jgi:hypothetical protein
MADENPPARRSARDCFSAAEDAMEDSMSTLAHLIPFGTWLNIRRFARTPRYPDKDPGPFAAAFSFALFRNT